VNLPEVVQGPIASEYGSDFFLLAATKKKPGETKQSCGITCTGPKGDKLSCPKPTKKKAQDFQPNIPGWSASPYQRSC